MSIRTCIVVLSSILALVEVSIVRGKIRGVLIKKIVRNWGVSSCVIVFGCRIGSKVIYIVWSRTWKIVVLICVGISIQVTFHFLFLFGYLIHQIIDSIYFLKLQIHSIQFILNVADIPANLKWLVTWIILDLIDQISYLINFLHLDTLITWEFFI